MDTQFGSSRHYRLVTSLTIAVFVLALLPGLAWSGPAALAQGETARIRVVHAVPDAGPVDVYVAGTKVLSNVPFFTVSAYLEITPGRFKVQVVRAGQKPSHATSLFEAQLSFAAGTDYSVVARGTVASGDDSALGGTLLQDDTSTPVAGQARLRVAHFSPDAPAVDIYANGAKVVSALSYTNASGYLSVPAGSYTIGVAPAGGAVIYTTTATLTAGQVVTAWANGLLGGSGAQAFKVTPTVDASYDLPAVTARIRAVHAVPDIAGNPVDVYLNDTKVVTFDFFTATDYLTVPAGVYNVRVVLAGGNPQTDAVISASVTLEADKVYSAVARGTANAGDAAPLGASLLQDDTSAPAAGQARLRVAHFSPDAPAVDIYANGAKVVSALSYTNASGYLSVPAGSYTIGVAPAGGAVIYTTTATLTAGQVVTSWANGLLGGSGAQAFKVTPTVDRAGSSPPSAAGRLRVLHGAPGAPSVDVFLNGERVVAGLAFANITAYRPVAAGTVAVQLNVAGSDTVIYSGGVTVDAGQDYTVAAIGAAGGSAAVQAAQLNLSVLKDDNTPQAGQAKLRLVHFAPNAPPVDLRAGQRVLVNDVGYGTGGGSYQAVQPGALAASVTNVDGSQVLLSANVVVQPNQVTTVFVVGLVGNVPPEQRLQALIVNDSAIGTSPKSLTYLPMSVR